MADLLLCLDSGCGIDLTNTAGRLGASIRTDAARALKCDATTRQLYVGFRPVTNPVTPGTDLGCANMLQVDASGDLWVPRTMGTCDITIPDTSFLDLPGAGDSDRDSDIDIYTNGTTCDVMVHWKYDVQVNVQSVGSFAAGDVMHWSGMISVENMGGGVGTYPASLRRTCQIPFSSTGLGAGDSYREWFQISGHHILNPGQTLRHRRIVYGNKKNAQVAGTTSSNNGVAFTNGSAMIVYGNQA